MFSTKEWVLKQVPHAQWLYVIVVSHATYTHHAEKVVLKDNFIVMDKTIHQLIATSLGGFMIMMKLAQMIVIYEECNRRLSFPDRISKLD